MQSEPRLQDAEERTQRQMQMVLCDLLPDTLDRRQPSPGGFGSGPGR
jgi:hypothetical protein